jgi:hypothetical protein
MQQKNSFTSNFKRLVLKNLLPVLLITAVFCFAFDWVLMNQVVLKSPNSGSYKIYRMTHENDPNEIPILGSSRASGSYMPDLIDTNCYNYGIEKSQCDLILFYLKEERRKKRSTPVIINFDYEMWNGGAENGAYFVPSLDLSSVRSYYKSRHEYDFTLRVPTLRFYGEMQEHIKTYLAERSGKNHLNKGGFILEDSPSNKVFQELVAQRRVTIRTLKTDQRKIERFEALIHSMKNRHFYLVVAPYHSSYFESITNINQGLSYLDKVNAFPNVTVLNYGNVDFPADHFQDTKHINYKGAVKFSEMLGQAIKTGKVANQAE